jgi:hypothetical protein
LSLQSRLGKGPDLTAVYAKQSPKAIMLDLVGGSDERIGVWGAINTGGFFDLFFCIAGTPVDPAVGRPLRNAF